MHFSLAACFAAFAVASCAHAGERTRYLELVNRAHDSIVSLAIAPAGGNFRDVPLGRALRGGGRSTTVEIAERSCRYDLRVEFSDRRTVVYRGFDLCRNGSLRIGKVPRG